MDFKEASSAEPKAHAKLFQINNGLMAQHHYDDLRVLLEGSSAYCASCHKLCQPPPERPDLFLAGFSCQPFSSMRKKHMKATPPNKHAKFDALPLVVEYCMKRQPRLAVLENTKGFGCEMEIDGRRVVGCEWLREQLSSVYFMSWVSLDLRAWVNVRRPRLWIFGYTKTLARRQRQTRRAHLQSRSRLTGAKAAQSLFSTTTCSTPARQIGKGRF